MLGTVEGLSPLDPQGRAANPFDPGAHLYQAVGDIDDLRLARGVLDQRLATGQHGGHQGIVGRAHRDLGKRNAVTGQAPGGPGVHIAALELDFGAERLERGQMQIDGARADGAAARQRDFRLAAARHERSEHPETRPHARHHLVGRRGVDDVRRGEPEGLAVARALARLLAGDGDVNPVIAQDAGKKADVGEARNIVQRQRLAGEKARNHQRQRSILGAADRYGPVQALAADNADSVHGVVTPPRAPTPFAHYKTSPVTADPTSLKAGPARQAYSASLLSVLPHREGSWRPHAPGLAPCVSRGWREAPDQGGRGAPRRSQPA